MVEVSTSKNAFSKVAKKWAGLVDLCGLKNALGGKNGPICSPKIRLYRWEKIMHFGHAVFGAPTTIS